MATIHKRKGKDGKERYTVEIRLKGYPRQTATFKRITDARQWEQATEASIKEGRHFKAAQSKKRTLAELIDLFKMELPRRRQDAKKLEVHLDWWAKHLGAYLLADINASRINETKRLLSTEKTRRGNQYSKTTIVRSNTTINRYMASLSVCLSYAVSDLCWLDHNPVDNVRKEREPNGRLRFLKKEENDKLFAAIEKHGSNQIDLITTLALSTGMRWSEIINLTWSNVDLKHRRIVLEKTKNGERRSIPLAKHAYDKMIEKSKVRRIDSDLVFPREDGKQPINPRKAWDKVVQKSGLTNLRFHDLRHTAASNLAMSGASLLEIADILGHKTLAMVKRYSHLTEGHTADVLERMNAKQFKEKG